LAVWGASGHALVVAAAIAAREEYEIVGFLDDVNLQRRGEEFGGASVLGGHEVLPSLYRDGIRHIALGFGNCDARMAIGEKLQEQGFELPTIIHPKSVVVDGATVGEGTVVAAGAIVEPECRIGRFAIINSGVIVCHHSRLEDGVHVCPGVAIGGWVRVGCGSWIGIGSCVKDRICIGSGSYIGAGSVVVSEIPDRVLAFGNPARVKRAIVEPF
jgi:UDP-N-acetylbacillosamine N-acetyltransferase